MNANPEIAVGNIVYLKSGSPPLVVETIEGQIVTFSWWSDGDLKGDALPLACLTMERPSGW